MVLTVRQISWRASPFPVDVYEATAVLWLNVGGAPKWVGGSIEGWNEWGSDTWEVPLSLIFAMTVHFQREFGILCLLHDQWLGMFCDECLLMEDICRWRIHFDEGCFLMKDVLRWWMFGDDRYLVMMEIMRLSMFGDWRTMFVLTMIGIDRMWVSDERSLEQPCYIEKFNNLVFISTTLFRLVFKKTNFHSTTLLILENRSHERGLEIVC